LANLHARPTTRDFGLCRPPLRRAITLATAAWFALTALTVLWVTMLRLDGAQGQALTERLGTHGTLTVLVLVAVLTVVGPLGEEVIFRGYIFRALRNRLGMAMCLLYHWTGSLYPGIAVHAFANAIPLGAALTKLSTLEETTHLPISSTAGIPNRRVSVDPGRLTATRAPTTGCSFASHFSAIPGPEQRAAKRHKKVGSNALCLAEAPV